MTFRKSEHRAELDPLRTALHVYFRALAGPPAHAAEDQTVALADLPQNVDVFSTHDDNRGWYRVAVAHRAAHVEYATDCNAVDAADRELFHVLEDYRVDERLRREYPGLRSLLPAVQLAELRERPSAEALPPPLAAYEALIQLTLGASPAAIHATAVFGRAVDEILRTLDTLCEPTAMTHTAVAATERITSVLSAAGTADLAWEQLLPPVRYREATDALFASPWPVAAPHAEDIGTPAQRAFDEAPQDTPAPDADRATRPLDVSEMLENEDDFATLAESDRGRPLQPVSKDAAPRTEAGSCAKVFRYPEWDFRAQSYRRQRCSVYERFPLASLTTRVLRETLVRYAHLLPPIRQHLERIVPDGYRLVRRVEHGEDLDLDASVDALIDMRAGVAPSERLDARRERGRRDIATVFLLDLSASTGEYLSGRPALARRIVDVERQCVALLLGAMERLGDAYAIYGFSGSGPEHVDFLVIKDLHEQLSNEVAGRIESIEPIRSTRMGAAVRHATYRLRRTDARTKLLLLISDGRPYDNDYGTEYGVQGRLDYAMHDTRVALDEARTAGIRSYLLTIDQNGADYLRLMCGNSNYEVLSDVELLPERVLALYTELIR